MEMHHSNAHLSFYAMGDTSTFIAKRRRAPVSRVSLYLRNQTRAILMRVSHLS
jgi:hypothetical protein